MLSLDDLEQLAGPAHVCVVRCGRAEESQLVYNYFCNVVLRVYASMEDYLLHAVFGYPSLTHSSASQIVLVVPPPHDEWALTAMPFPYDIEASLSHWVLWRNSPAQDMTAAEQIISQKFRGRRVVWFSNHEHARTVRGLFHVHIFF